MKTLRHSLLFCLLAASMPAAWADAYISGHAGVSMLEDTVVTGVPGEPDLGIDLDFGRDAAVSGAAGIIMGNARLDLEFAMQRNEVNFVEVTGLPSAPATFDLTGRVRSKGLTVNGYYDFPTGTRLRPYVTLGAGFTQVDVLVDAPGIPEISADSQETSVTYQAGVGLGIDLTQRTTLDLRYRYVTNDNTEYGDANMNHESHNFMAGLRFRF